MLFFCRFSLFFFFIFFAYLKGFSGVINPKDYIEKNKQLSDSVLIAHLLDSAHALKFTEFSTSIEYAEESLKLTKKNGDKINEANAYNVIGICNHLQNNYPKAFEYYKKALDIFIAEKMSRGQASSLINIGILYSDQDNPDESIKYYFKALEIAKSIKDSVNTSAIYNNIGINYQNKKMIDTALVYYNKSLELRKLIGDPNLLSSSYSSIATAYSQKKEENIAIDYHLKSLQIDSTTGNKRALSITLSNLASSYCAINNFTKAIEYSDKALKQVTELSYVQLYPDIYYNRFIIYEKMKDFKNAYKFALKYVNLKDSLSIVESNKTVMELQAKYDSRLKENEILVLNAQNEAQTHKIDRQKNITYFLITLAFLLVSVVFIGIRAYRNKIKSNQLISLQNEELIKQKEEIHQKNKLVEEKSVQLQHAYREIKDSINYAKRIQEAILPNTNKLLDFEKSHSILYHPKDVVSGDFYWFEKINNKYIFATADCTGHGVPGAFMSMIGVNNLNQIIIDNRNTEPSKILSELNISVKKALNQKDENNSINDGMDISIICFDTEKNNVSYSGAFRPLIYIRNNELFEIKGSRNPIGGNAPMDFIYELHQFEYLKGDVFYMFSDGFADQFGGKNGKKFMNKQLKETFLEIHQENPQNQKQLLEEKLLAWRGENEQIDDVLVLVVKI